MVETTNWEPTIISSVKDTIKKYGHFMAHRKALPGKDGRPDFCPCILESAESPKKECTLCLGTGRLFADYLVKGRQYTPRPSVGTEQLSPLGVAGPPSPMFMIEPIIPVTTMDFLLELVLDKLTNEPLRPYKIRQAYSIVHVDVKRDIDGEICFYQIKAEMFSWDNR